MSKSLVIVESPAKAKTIGKVLGGDYVVKASMGHVRDLPKSGLGVAIEDGFEADWEPIESRAKVLKELKAALGKAGTLYLATDPDREGEAIAWHLVESLVGRGSKDLDIRRVIFHEITPNAVRAAFEHPGEVNEARVDAYRTRRILDRLVGYQLSPILWKKLSRGLSAGRVQSVAVRLVVEREREIRAFVPEEYWRLLARFGDEESGFRADFVRLDGSKHALKTRADALAVLRRLDPGTPAGADADHVDGVTVPLTVSALESQSKTARAKPPFITSTLQQAAASRYGFSAKRTMSVAQQLYEGIDLPGEGSLGLITYMRTDSFNLSPVARAAAAKLITSTYGERYLPETPNAYRSKKGAQEAHEAIRPTEPARSPESLRSTLKPDQWKLYDLVWRRFMASQMAPARYEVTQVELSRHGVAFEATGRVMTFDGYMRVYGRDESEGQQLPALAVGQEITPDALLATQHFTQPPRRYTEASLVRALEKHGIGRPSTYASILSTIVDRKYVDHGEEAEEERFRRESRDPELKAKAEEEARRLAAAGDAPEAGGGGASGGDDEEDEGDVPARKRKGAAFHATHLGEATTDLLMPQFGDIVNTQFTANLEDQLDEVAEGRLGWQRVVEDFYAKFARDLETAEADMPHYQADPIPVDDVTCDKVDETTGAVCGAPMVILFNRFGTYLGCSRYPQCRSHMPLSGVARQESQLTEHRCKKCGRPMEEKVNRWGGRFLGCIGFKDKSCNGTVSLSKSGEPLWPVDTSVACPECGTLLVVKRSRRGKFLACPEYPRCRGTMSLPKCPHTSRSGTECGKPMTEPAAGGRMACKLHPGEAVAPKPRGAGDGDAKGGGGATAAGPAHGKGARGKTGVKAAGDEAGRAKGARGAKARAKTSKTATEGAGGERAAKGASRTKAAKAKR